jgi:hypothetical protein
VAPSIPPLRHQPAALIGRDVVFHDCLLDRRIGVRLIFVVGRFAMAAKLTARLARLRINQMAKN